ncbi:MAG: galactose oxidase [Verrucomicrobiota bacterium]
MPSSFQWSQLPAIPDQEGFAGAFAGVSNGALVVAGGANIVGERWANPLQKKWYQSVFVLERPSGAWLTGFQLPRALGYGVSITTPDGLLCIGGSDATQHFADVFLLRWQNGKIESREFPPLPRPCANACGALVGNTVYVAGGLVSPTATVTLKTFWALDLSAPSPSWKELEPWPGPGRMLAIAGSQNGSFFLFSGTGLSADQEGKPVRHFLRDAYCFTPGQGWQRLADLPRAAVAGPSPAPSLGDSKLLILSGDDGTNVDFAPIEEHPGFPKDILSYEIHSNQWTNMGAAPFSRATVPVVSWLDQAVFVNGEVRPRVRTPEVWALELGGVR